MRPRKSALLALAAMILTAGVLAANENPPTNLKMVGDHWTAWDPPMSFPEGAEVYIIQKGDTLWDLANQYYGDPYLWPQIWERNQYILDAHWIYPGDPLVMGVIESSTIPLSFGADVHRRAARRDLVDRPIGRSTRPPPQKAIAAA